MVDNGIRNIMSNNQNYDSEIPLRISYILSLRRGFEVYVGKYKEIEVDFVAIKPNETIYYQVTKTMLDERVEECEKKSLLSINDNYPKIILTMDKVKNKTIDGIKVINIIDFLLEE